MIAHEDDTLGATLRKKLKVVLMFWFLLASIGCGTGSTNHGTSTDDITSYEAVVVNSLSDKVVDVPWLPEHSMTLREAIEKIAPGGTITFDPSLNGKTIKLRSVGSSHSILKGEVYAGGPRNSRGMWSGITANLPYMPEKI